MYRSGTIRQALLVVVSSVAAYRYSLLFATDLSAFVEQRQMTPQSTTLPPTKPASLNLPDVVKRSLTVPDDPYNITAALCHKTLFGDIDLWMVLDWVAYNRLLGFDRIFMSYVPSVMNLEGFEELNSLPYVTLFENTEAIETIVYGNYHRLGATGAMLNASSSLKSDHSCNTDHTAPQMLLEARCLDQDAHSFDWVMLSDADEYLWFNEKIGVKEFLHHRNDRFDYISLGKRMYTMKHKVNINSTATKGFNLDNSPFTAGVYCEFKNRQGQTKHVCPRKPGRAKVMLKPSVHHGHVCIHGTHYPKKRMESIHISAKVAHFMEWNGATLKTSAAPTTREKKSFRVNTTIEETGLHPYTQRAYSKNRDKSMDMHYDDKLHKWLDFVASRGQLVEPD
jgi:hypothetical protein